MKNAFILSQFPGGGSLVTRIGAVEMTPGQLIIWHTDEKLQGHSEEGRIAFQINKHKSYPCATLGRYPKLHLLLVMKASLHIFSHD